MELLELDNSTIHKQVETLCGHDWSGVGETGLPRRSHRVSLTSRYSSCFLKAVGTRGEHYKKK